MPTQYAGNPNNYPASAGLPADSDPRSAASVNVPFEAVLDRTAFLKKRGVVQEIRFRDSVENTALYDFDTNVYTSGKDPAARGTGPEDPKAMVVGVEVGDLMIVHVHGSFVTTAADFGHFRLRAIHNYEGTPVPVVVASVRVGENSVAAAGAFSLTAIFAATAAGDTHILLEGKKDNGTGVLHIVDEVAITGLHVRANA